MVPVVNCCTKSTPANPHPTPKHYSKRSTVLFTWWNYIYVDVNKQQKSKACILQWISCPRFNECDSIFVRPPQAGMKYHFTFSKHWICNPFATILFNAEALFIGKSELVARYAANNNQHALKDCRIIRNAQTNMPRTNAEENKVASKVIHLNQSQHRQLDQNIPNIAVRLCNGIAYYLMHSIREPSTNWIWLCVINYL